MQKLPIIVLIGLSFLLMEDGDSSGTPQNAPSTLDEAISDARKTMTEMLSAYPGLSISVGIEDSIVWEEGFGFSNVEHNEVMKPEHLLRYYSLSKSLTGMALIKLIEDEKLDIEKNLVDYLDDLPAAYRSVKIKHLISHTSGIRSYGKGEWMRISQDNCVSSAEGISVFINDPLKSEPGEIYSYSSFNYVLLSYVIEEVTGLRYYDFMQEALFSPLGTSSITLDQSQDRTQESTYYSKWSAKCAKGSEARAVNNSCKFGGGGLLGSASDLVKLHLAMLNQQIVSAPFTEQYYNSFESTSGEKVKYAYGIGDRTSQSGDRFHAHTGSGMGANTILIIYPSAKLVIVVLGNIERKLINEKIGEIAKPFLDFIN